ncbi:alpha/beta fold hydrolase [Microlunatus speluncae]|uniref:alpha/beta fold hydrolase n=1 Tax=Microlunatus speluncae TaxID=2594267 RepID=UPI0012667871|nr:alpha/beta hydrolase [Microlunatus speluncae]
MTDPGADQDRPEDERPTSTADLVAVIRELGRLTTPGAIDERRVIELGGVPQVVSVRGRDRRNPIMIIVHGGPGTPLSGTSWMWQRPLEEYFTVVQYDQRGAGRSFRLSDPDRLHDDLHLARYARDTVELAEVVRSEFGADQVTVAGHSWGTAVAVEAVLARPELFSAYLGIGQVVSVAAGERASWDWVRAEAERRGDPTAQAELDALLPYPGTGPLDLGKVITERTWVQRFGGFAAGRADGDYFTDGDLLSPDYDDDDRDSSLAGNEFHARHLLPTLNELDLTQVKSFPIPIIQFLGRHDGMTPTGPVITWLDTLQAPAVIIEWFEDSAHLPMFEEPGHFLIAVLKHLLPHAGPAGRNRV